MAAIGLTQLAELTLQVSGQVLPQYRSKFSKHQFTQPQLLTILCLMRYEDWTYREAEARLLEHSDLRRVLRLQSVPDYTTLYRFLKRLQPEDVRRVLQAVVKRMPGKRQRRTVAVDATGLAKGAISSYFIRRMQDHTGQPTSRRHWLKWLLTVDVQQQLILAQAARRGPWNDCATLPQLVNEAHQIAPIGCVLADAEFDSERNHTFIRGQLHACSIIPAKRRSSQPASGIRAFMRNAFPHKQYRQRNLIESVFSAVKRKLTCRASGRSFATQSRQALLLGLTCNLYRLRPFPLV